MRSGETPVFAFLSVIPRSRVPGQLAGWGARQTAVLQQPRTSTSSPPPAYTKTAPRCTHPRSLRRHTLPSANVALTRCTRVIVAADPPADRHPPIRVASSLQHESLLRLPGTPDCMSASTGSPAAPRANNSRELHRLHSSPSLRKHSTNSTCKPGPFSFCSLRSHPGPCLPVPQSTSSAPRRLMLRAQRTRTFPCD